MRETNASFRSAPSLAPTIPTEKKHRPRKLVQPPPFPPKLPAEGGERRKNNGAFREDQFSTMLDLTYISVFGWALCQLGNKVCCQAPFLTNLWNPLDKARQIELRHAKGSCSVSSRTTSTRGGIHAEAAASGSRAGRLRCGRALPQLAGHRLRVRGRLRSSAAGATAGCPPLRSSALVVLLASTLPRPHGCRMGC